MTYNRRTAQANVQASIARTQAALDSARTRLNDPTLTPEQRQRTTANLASHTRHLAECHDAQAALNDGDNPEGWA